MNVENRIGTVVAGTIAVLAFLSVPMFWLSLLLRGYSGYQIEHHPVAPLVITVWPWVYSIAAHAAAFGLISGKPVQQVWQPVLVLFLAISMPSVLAVPLVFISVIFMGDSPWPMYLIMLSVFYCSYLFSRLIVRRWFSERLGWQDKAWQRFLLVLATALPPMMALAADLVHLKAINPLP